MNRVTIKNEDGAILAVLYVEGKVIVKETNGVSVETDGDDLFDPETCNHQAAVQVGDQWYCPGCESYIEWPHDDTQ